VARIYEDLGHWDEACACYERALALARSAPVGTQAASRLAGLCKRAGRPERAVDLWRRLIQSDRAAWAPYVELAKHYEHRARDYAAAIAIVEQALAVLELRELRHRPRAALERADLERRLARLLAKQRREAGPPADRFAPSPASAGQLRIASTRNQR
jgi:tetratricopeptide (TPR) repeat protein